MGKGALWAFISTEVIALGIIKSIMSLSIEDVILCMALASFITYFIEVGLRVRALKREMKLSGSPTKDVAQVMKRCYTLFPIEKIVFKGQTYQRGMLVRLTTMSNNNFEGEFIGGNIMNMICIKTGKQIIAHEVQNIKSLTIIKNNV